MMAETFMVIVLLHHCITSKGFYNEDISTYAVIVQPIMKQYLHWSPKCFLQIYLMN